MNTILPWVKKNIYIFIIPLLTLLAFIILFTARSLDDNRLTNWEWAFTYTEPVKVFLFFLPGILLAYLFSKLSVIERYPAAFLFLFSFALSSLFWREPEIMVDASRYFTQAKHLEVYGAGYFLREWGRGISAWTDLPLLPFIYGLIFRFFGEARIYVQIFTTVLFSLTGVFTYLIGKTLWDRDTGFFGGMLLLGIPYLFVQVPLLMVDIPTMFFVTFAFFSFIRALEGKGKLSIVFSSSAIALAFFTKYSAWLMLSVLPVIFLVYVIRKPKDTTPANYFARGSIIFLIALFLTCLVFWHRLDFFSEQIRFLLDYQRLGIKRWSESFVSTFFFQVHPFITLAALYSVYVAFKKRDLRYAIVSWLVFLVFLLQIRRARYILVTFPMLSLMASYGLMQLGNRKAVKFLSLCIISFSVVIAVFAYFPMLQKLSPVNLREAGEFLNSLEAENIGVYTLRPQEPAVNIAVSVPALDYFTSKKILYNYRPEFPLNQEEIETSPLRFTWEYRNPGYYSSGARTEYSAIVIVHGEKDISLPEDIKERVRSMSGFKEFKISDDIFAYQTFVAIYY